MSLSSLIATTAPTMCLPPPPPPSAASPALHRMRINYGAADKALLANPPTCPITLLSTWLSDATNVLKPPHETNAMLLATATPQGRPSARMVLLKRLDKRGLVWYTHYTSRKGRELNANPYAACTFWWAELERSVRVEGHVKQLSAAENDEYFNSRPPTSRLGALASVQSEQGGADVVRERYNKLEAHHLNSEGEVVVPIVRPSTWGGYLLQPSRVEFWKGREARLHDRLVYTRTGDKTSAEGAEAEADEEIIEWTTQRLQP